MKRIHIFLIITIGFIFTSCTTTKVVGIDYSREFDFSKISTYRFDHSSPSGLNELDSIRLYESITSELQAKGLTKSEDSPNTILLEQSVYESGSANNTAVGVGMGGGTFGGGVGGGITVGIPINRKTMIQEYTVSLFHGDPENQTKSLVWLGELDIEISQNASVETKEAAINKGVRKLFNNYPPAKK